MQLDDLDDAGLINAAESLLYCLKEGADEDAYNWATHILWALHGRTSKELGTLEMQLESIAKATRKR